jgi:hypothetical protein
MYSRLPGSGAVILIADSGMLMGEVMQSSRPPAGSLGQGRVTSLLWALHRGGAVLVLPRHVVEEVERDLHRRATAGDDVELAYRRLRTLYLPHARIVDVPPDWGAGDPRVEAVAARHPVDAPTARLAVGLGYSFLLSEDPDLCDQPRLGFKAWLAVTHAAATATEMDTLAVSVSVPLNVAGEVIGVVSRRIAVSSTTAKWVMLGGAVVLTAGLVWAVRSGRAARFLDQARPVLQEISETYGPVLGETFTRYEAGQRSFASAAVPPASASSLAELIARVLVVKRSPMLAEDIARELQGPGNLRDRTRLVRAELCGSQAFVEVSRGRWIFGRPSRYPAEPFPAAEIVEYLDRRHKRTRPSQASRVPDTLVGGLRPVQDA